MRIIRPISELHLPFHHRREAATLILLTGLAVVLFLVVSVLANLYKTQQDDLSSRWASRGASDLKAARYKDAVEDFHSALRYSRDDYSQQLGLAEALIGLKQIDEASAYLKTLWEQQPEDGTVNRELARIAAGKHDSAEALRYYHDAIYAIWPQKSDAERRNTQWELIKYLLSLNAKAQAQSELISLSADAGDNPSQQIELGAYFLQVQDSGHALKAYRSRLAEDPADAEALSGAGRAAFNMGDYRAAERYLRKAVVQNPGEREAAKLLHVAEFIFSLDPFRYDSSASDRIRITMADFQAAGQRLQLCPTIAQQRASGQAQMSLSDSWIQLNPNMTVKRLRSAPPLLQQAFDLISQIEQQGAQECGPGSATDQALALIAGMHEGS